MSKPGLEIGPGPMFVMCLLSAFLWFFIITVLMWVLT